MSGLFSTLNTARTGIMAQQTAIDTTANNMSNASTDGYSRERVNMVATEQDGITEFGTSGPHAGTGVQVTDVMRIRDAFLDYQVREQTSNAGNSQYVSSYLTQLENIMQEPTSSGLSAQLSNFFSAWSELSKAPGSGSSARTSVCQQTLSLTNQLNYTYDKMEELKTNCQTSMKSYVEDINSKLDKIDILNDKITALKTIGQEPNALMDQRDSLVDSISQYFGVKTDTDDVGGLTLKADGSAYSDETFIQPKNTDEESRLSYIDDIEPTKDGAGNLVKGGDGLQEYTITYYKSGDESDSSSMATVNVTGMSSDDYNSIEKYRILFSDKTGVALGTTDGGTVDFSKLKTFTPGAGASGAASTTGTCGGITGTAEVQDKIDSYINQLNTFAKALALSVNIVESGQTTVDTSNVTTTNNASADSEPFFVNSDAAKYNLDPSGKATSFSTKYTDADEAGITAGNITLNEIINDNNSEIKTRTNDDEYSDESYNTDTDGGSGDGSRASAVSALQNTLLNVTDISSESPASSLSSRAQFLNSMGLSVATGDKLTYKDSNGVTTIQSYAKGSTVGDYYISTIDNVGSDADAANSNYKTQNGALSTIKDSRNSVSGVSMDEELTYLIQYQHAYSANAKVISTVSDLLDVVIGLIK